jgi:hypothetical protein
MNIKFLSANTLSCVAQTKQLTDLWIFQVKDVTDVEFNSSKISFHSFTKITVIIQEKQNIECKKLARFLSYNFDINNVLKINQDILGLMTFCCIKLSPITPLVPKQSRDLNN